MVNQRKKIVYGQFFTREQVWLRPQIKAFIEKSNAEIAYDPFAGAGHLLSVAKKNLGFKKLKGLDIDNSLSWEINDSLLSIPHIEKAIIITNPPYISNYSASRKKIDGQLKKYFSSTIYDDIYFLALDKMIDAQKYVVAIIPETFINSSYKRKNLLSSITILEENPFDDTATPVIVACFDGKEKDFNEIKIYKNDEFVGTLEKIENARLIPDNSIKLKFNDKDGWLGIRCVDTTNPLEMLRFDFKENIKYDWEKGIKTSSRLLTLIDIDIQERKKQEFIECCNEILNQIRKDTSDIILSPFKGNMKNGKRRRRLDFKTCRAILEKSYKEINNLSIKENTNEQLSIL